ncbi:MAG: FtsX-like permease family protein [Pseudomonadota bacterium]
MAPLQDMLRALRRAPFSNATNLAALVLGFACFLGAWAVAAHWGLHDYQQSKADRIFAVTQQHLRDGLASRPRLYNSLPLAKYMRLDIPELEKVARLREPVPWTAAGADWKAALSGADAEQQLLDIFDFTFIYGNPETALASPGGIVLTKRIADRYYADRDPVGETIILRGNREHMITGVIEDIAPPSFFGDDRSAQHRFDFLRAWPAPRPNRRENWNHYTTLTYALTPEGEGDAWLMSFRQKLNALAENRMPSDQWARVNFRHDVLSLKEMTSRHLDTQFFMGARSILTVEGLLYGLGALVLLVACLNYVGLATALSSLRAREIGMRKVLGSSQGQISLTIWLEALTLTVLAGLIAFALLLWAAPLIERYANVDVLIVFSERPDILATFAGVVLLVSLAVSVYPALYLTRMMRPVDALRLGQSKSGPQRLTPVLVGAQFFFASALLIFILVMDKQSAYLEERSRSVAEDPVAIIADIPSRFIGIDKLKGALDDEPSIKAVSTTYFTPWGRCCIVDFFTATRAAQSEEIAAVVSRVGPEFFQVYDATLLAGRLFDPARDKRPDPDATESPDEYPVIIDVDMARRLGFETAAAAVGQLVYNYDVETEAASAGNAPYRIIGVVETLSLMLSTGDLRSNIYMIGGIVPIVRFHPDRTPEAMTAIRNAVESFVPNAVVDIQFTDALFRRSFETYQGFYATLAALSAIAFVIAAIGLLGMVTFAANRRRHDIGVRKTLGATSRAMVFMLLRDFTRPILIGNLLAWPAAWFVAREYMENFMDRVPLTPWPWIIGLAATLAFAWLIIGAHAYRAARTSPIEVLRDE